MNVGFYHAGMSPTHVTMAGLLVRSVRKHMPTVPVVHFTDQGTAPIAGVDHVYRRESGPIALRCLEAYAACEGQWLFVDSDVIVQRDVRWIFDESFDVAVSERAGTLKAKEVGSKFMARMPYNKGAVFSRSPEFWTHAVSRLRAMSAKRIEWMGDQVAMCDTIASGLFNVRILPSRYNYPPQSRDENLNDKAIIHWKGSRKAWLLERAA